MVKTQYSLRAVNVVNELIVSGYSVCLIDGI